MKIMKEMGDMGFLGCTIPDYDLPGISSVAYGKFLIDAYNSLAGVVLHQNKTKQALHNRLLRVYENKKGLFLS